MLDYENSAFSCSLALDQGSISALGLDTTEQAWVETMLQYRMAALNPMGEGVCVCV